MSREKGSTAGALAPGTYDLEAGGQYVFLTPAGDAPPPPATLHRLTVQLAGDGAGIVTGLVEGGQYPDGSEVVLHGMPDPGCQFDGFDVAMPVVMDADKTVTATFSRLPMYTLTVASAGTGSGIADGGGEYVAGTVIEAQVSAHPAPGSTFDGWTPPLPLTMDADDKVLTATFTLLPPPPPPITGAGTWTKLADVPTSLWAYGFEGGCFDSRRGEFMTHWPQGGCRSATWPVAGGPWSEWPDSTSGETPGDAAHNSVAVYDPINDRMWFSAFGPLPKPGAYGWNPATRKYFRYGATGAGTQVDALMVFDPVRQQLLAIGGYSNTNGAVSYLPLVPMPTDQSAWGGMLPPTGPALRTVDKPAPSVGLRLTYTRGGWDPGLNCAWLVDDYGNLWRYWPQSNAWAQHVTTGDRPPVDTVYAMDSISRLVVGWSGKALDTQASIQQTRVLNLATLEWLPGPSGGAGTPDASTVASTSGYTINGRAHFLISTGLSRLFRWMPTNPDPVQPPPVTIPPPSGGGSGGGTPPPPPPPPPTTEPPPPALPYPDVAALPRRVFVPVTPPSVTTGLDTTPWPSGGGSKHQRWAADGQGRVWTGFGDTSPSHYPGNPSQGQGYVLDIGTGAWRRWNPPCRPAGQIQPSYPDEVVWAYDKRGAFWLLGGVTQGSDGAVCPEGGTLYRTGLFKYEPETDLWSRFPEVVGTNALYGHFDNRDHCLMYIGSDTQSASGSALYKVHVDTMEQRRVFSADFSAVPFPGPTPGTFEDWADMRIHPWAWDEVDRLAYVVGYHNRKVASETVGQVRHLWSLHVDTGKVTQLPDPPDPSTAARNPDANSLVFDTKNRRVVWPAVTNHCGVVEAMLVYDVATRTWVSHPLEPLIPISGGKVRANTAVYDPFHDVVVLGGSVACAEWGFPNQPNITHYFYWRG